MHKRAVEDNKHVLYNSTSGTSVHNSSKEGERSLCMNHSNLVDEISTLCQSFYVVDI